MAQASENNQLGNNDRNEGSSKWAFKFNAAAPEFVPRSYGSQAEVPFSGYFYPYFQYFDGSSENYVYIADQESTIPLVENNINSKAGLKHNQRCSNENALTDELKEKIVKQAEYMFSDMSMITNESFAKHVSKDPEGYVPINFVTTTKKLKSLNVTNQMVAQALWSSSNLVLSNDGKKVRRKHPLTEKEKENLQLRTVIADNLPDDHSRENIEKLFSVVGSIKSIRICQPQDQNLSRSSKCDSVISNKLHALVEYENSETAEQAVEKLNDERDWRKGMRVRVMLKRSPKSVLKSRKPDFDMFLDDDEGATHQLNEDASLEVAEVDENSTTLKRSWSRNQEKTKNRPQIRSAHSLPTPSSLSNIWFSSEISARQTTKGPRMPDGTRGFTMGRGKPLRIPIQSG
ncbi:putative RNA-binding protein [Handroanthus impetiginosus]|uniref:Putative RNA-binding protein n=1 Tax=Handroanthus impetiginosus TaxID=429701 RepID=A0A2G9H9P0_9LAMI|nr:putative RNA-binding protein [Handroanthus impetiginosus]